MRIHSGKLIIIKAAKRTTAGIIYRLPARISQKKSHITTGKNITEMAG